MNASVNTSLSPETRAIVVRQLGAALADAWRRQQQQEQQQEQQQQDEPDPAPRPAASC